MLSRKRIPQNMAFWSNVQPYHEIHNIRWEEHLQQMNFTNFTQLEHYVRANPLLQMEFLNVNDEMLQCEKSRLDYIALHHLPTDAPDGYAPVNIFGDGNCFPRTCSYLVGKNEDRYTEFHVCIVYELVQNKDIYLNDTYVSKGASIIYGRGSTVDQITMFSEHYNPMLRIDTETLYNLELLDICKDGAYMGMWWILAAANILQHPICSVYPDLRGIVRPDLNRRVYCYNEALNTKRLLHIMWTPMSVNSQDPCHFVPLLTVVRRIKIVMKIYEFMNFTNVFHFYICRAVKLLAIEKKLAQQKENQVKRDDDEQATRTQTTDEGRGT